MLGKAPGLGADMVFLDLEDSVAPKEKEAARPIIADAIKNGDWGDKVVCVRVNDWSTKWTVFDVLEIVTKSGERLDEIMLPKVESAAQVVALDMVLRQAEIAAGLPIGHVGIEAQIETARGLIAVEEICAASPRLETIIFGPADFAASMEMPVLTGGVAVPEYPGDHFHYVFNKILMAGGTRRRCASTASGPARSASTASGPSTPTRCRSSTRCSARPRSSSTRRGRSSTPTSRRPRARARARSCSATR
jgi:citrate lyase subunit beta/citryl-CoA lyase